MRRGVGAQIEVEGAGRTARCSLSAEELGLCPFIWHLLSTCCLPGRNHYGDPSTAGPAWGRRACPRETTKTNHRISTVKVRGVVKGRQARSEPEPPGCCCSAGGEPYPGLPRLCRPLGGAGPPAGVAPFTLP